MDGGQEREELRYFTMVPGELFVTTDGIYKTLEWFVVNFVSLALSVLHTQLILVKEVVRYGWMRCSAWVMRELSRIVSTENGVFTTVSTAKMPQSFV